MDVVDSLRKSGIAVDHQDPPSGPDAHADAILDVLAAERRARFAVSAKRRAPYRRELDRLQASWQALSRLGRPLLLVPFASEALGSALTSADWSWADAQGNFDLRAPGLWLRRRRAFSAPVPKRKTLPRGSGSFAVIRALLGLREHEGEEPGATALAGQAGVSQPRVSQVLHRLQELELVERIGRGRWRPRREALLDHFLAEYPGPGGSEGYFYGLESPTDMAVRASQSSTLRHPIAISADVGPDLIAPWRRPNLVIVYAKYPIDQVGLGLVEAQGKHDANVIVRIPEDRSVFPSRPLPAHVRGREISLADPAQQIWDLEDLGGADRAEAAGRLREWLLTRP
jgi:DNA-binding transcriptional ArsR family regulator